MGVFWFVVSRNDRRQFSRILKNIKDYEKLHLENVCSELIPTCQELRFCGLKHWILSEIKIF